jgi:UDP-glucose 4-epimerase
VGSILVTGGAGYIGAEVATQLSNLGFEVVIIDNLSTGERKRVPNSAVFYECDISDQIQVKDVFERHSISTVFHFAAYKQARESLLLPSKYWSNNVHKLIAFLEVLKSTSIENFVFSSSCSVYGDAGIVQENSFLKPVSPYGWSKFAGEEICTDYAKEFSWKYVALRYFNVIGASQREFAGDYTSNCILPSMFRKSTSGEMFTIHGGDFPTRDGFAIRDYISVIDVAAAHISAIKLLESGFQGSLNVSSGKPVSVYEIVKAFQSIDGTKLEFDVDDRNLADPAEIWGLPSPILLESGWKISQSFSEALGDHWKSFQRFYQPLN